MGVASARFDCYPRFVAAWYDCATKFLCSAVQFHKCTLVAMIVDTACVGLFSIQYNNV